MLALGTTAPAPAAVHAALADGPHESARRSPGGWLAGFGFGWLWLALASTASPAAPRAAVAADYKYSRCRCSLSCLPAAFLSDAGPDGSAGASFNCAHSTRLLSDPSPTPPSPSSRRRPRLRPSRGNPTGRRARPAPHGSTAAPTARSHRKRRRCVPGAPWPRNIPRPCGVPRSSTAALDGQHKVCLLV